MAKTGELHRADSTVKMIRDIWGLLKGRRTRFWAASFLELTSNLAWLYPAYALASIVTFLTNYQAGQSFTEIYVIAGLWIFLSFWHYWIREAANYIGFQISERTSLDAMQRTVEHLLLLDLSWHEKENSGNKLKRIQKGGEGIDRILRIWFENAIQITVNFVGMTLILAKVDLTVAGGVLLFLITYFALSYFFTKHAGNAAYIVNVGEEDLQGVAFETINNIRSVKVLGMRTGLLGIIQHKLDDLFCKIRTRIRWFRTRSAVLNIWAQVFRIGLTFFIAWGIIRGHYEVGFLVLFYMYFNYIWESIDRLSNVVLDFVIAKYGISRMVDILNEPITIDLEDGKRAFPEDWKTITLEAVTFAYTEGKPVLKNFSLQINRGERLGIIGVSGSGKSTLFTLLLKEHEHYDGKIMIDDVLLRDIKRTDLFKHSSVVLQDTEVFNFKLRDNITLSNVEESENEELINQSIEIAHVNDFLHKLPDGLDTHIGEKGVKLSGGEKQRVGIARAIFKQPQILFLDEATSHLDLESEEKIRDTLHQFFQTVTAVVIAHRLSTIKEMDRIIVLEDGQIIEEGTFEQLHAKKGRFYELWEKQKF